MIRRLFRPVACLLALPLAACTAVGPDYREEIPAHPLDWATPAPGVVPADPRSLASWWRSFNDPLLDELVQRAIEGNRDLAIARQRLLQARAERDQVASRLAPQLSAGGEANAQRSAKALDYPPGIGESRTYRLGLDASWEVDVFGGRRRALEAADAQVQAVAEDESAVLVSLLAELANDYAALRATQQRTLIARDNLATLVAAERLAEKAYERGLGTTMEVAQARAERGLGEARLPELAADEERLIHALGVLSGDFPGGLQECLASRRPILLDPPSLRASLPSEVVRNRPDIRAAERRLAASTARIGVAEAERFPRFVIPLGLGTSASLVRDLFSDASLAWSLGIVADQTLYDGGRREAGVRAAEAEARAMRLAYQQSVRVAFRDVEDALSGLNAERLRQASLRGAVKDSQDALGRATRLYRNGLSGYLSVLTAQRATYQARDALALSRMAHTQHVIGLYKSLGAGWQASTTLPRPASTNPASLVRR